MYINPLTIFLIFTLIYKIKALWEDRWNTVRKRLYLIFNLTKIYILNEIIIIFFTTMKRFTPNRETIMSIRF